MKSKSTTQTKKRNPGSPPNFRLTKANKKIMMRMKPNNAPKSKSKSRTTSAQKRNYMKMFNDARAKARSYARNMPNETSLRRRFNNKTAPLPKLRARYGRERMNANAKVRNMMRKAMEYGFKPSPPAKKTAKKPTAKKATTSRARLAKKMGFKGAKAPSKMKMGSRPKPRSANNNKLIYSYLNEIVNNIAKEMNKMTLKKKRPESKVLNMKNLPKPKKRVTKKKTMK
mgnify:CR=1 FL=1